MYYNLRYSESDDNNLDSTENTDDILSYLLRYNTLEIIYDDYYINVTYHTEFNTIDKFEKQTILNSNISINCSYYNNQGEFISENKSIADNIFNNYLKELKINFNFQNNRFKISIKDIINNKQINNENKNNIINILNYIIDISDDIFNDECKNLYNILQNIEQYIDKNDIVNQYLNNKNRLSIHKKDGYQNSKYFYYSIVQIFDSNFVLQIDNFTAEIRIMISDDIEFIKNNPHNYQNKWLKCYILKILHLRLLKNNIFKKLLTLESPNNKDDKGNDLYYIVYEREIYICQKLLILIKHYNTIQNDLINISNKDLTDLIKIYEEPTILNNIYTILFD
jgi:hypothetical protein